MPLSCPAEASPLTWGPTLPGGQSCWSSPKWREVLQSKFPCRKDTEPPGWVGVALAAAWRFRSGQCVSAAAAVIWRWEEKPRARGRWNWRGRWLHTRNAPLDILRESGLARESQKNKNLLKREELRVIPNLERLLWLCSGVRLELERSASWAASNMGQRQGNNGLD